MEHAPGSNINKPKTEEDNPRLKGLRSALERGPKYISNFIYGAKSIPEFHHLIPLATKTSILHTANELKTAALKIIDSHDSQIYQYGGEVSKNKGRRVLVGENFFEGIVGHNVPYVIDEFEDDLPVPLDPKWVSVIELFKKLRSPEWYGRILSEDEIYKICLEVTNSLTNLEVEGDPEELYYELCDQIGANKEKNVVDRAYEAIRCSAIYSLNKEGGLSSQIDKCKRDIETGGDLSKYSESIIGSAKGYLELDRVIVARHVHGEQISLPEFIEVVTKIHTYIREEDPDSDGKCLQYERELQNTIYRPNILDIVKPKE